MTPSAIVPTALRQLIARKEVVAALIQAAGTLLSAVVIGVFGGLISKRYARLRDQQDKESQWRTHAAELTKLEIQRKLGTRQPGDTKPMRPSILDFLANYRDLKELDKLSPRELYLRIEESRIEPEAKPTRGEAGPSSEKGRLAFRVLMASVLVGIPLLLIARAVERTGGRR